MSDIDEKAKKIAEDSRKAIKEMISDGKLPEAKPFTRSQRKELDKSGNNFFKPKAGEKRQFFLFREDCSDYILDHFYKDFDWDSIPNNICLAFTDYVMGLTYRDEIAEKN